jgi:hypothetical protein
MHHLEPFWKWRDRYDPDEDERSPFYGREHSEFEYSQKIYNYYIHPQWDEFGSPTLYLKILFADYRRQFAIIEFIGEWNDCITNDIMFLKRDVVDVLINEGINKFVLIGENVLNFHASDNCYYEEWSNDVTEQGGWIIGINFREHVLEEMLQAEIHYYMYISQKFGNIPWRKYQPHHLVSALDDMLMKRIGS